VAVGPLRRAGLPKAEPEVASMATVGHTRSYSNTQVTDQFGNSIHATPDPISATVHIQV